MFDFCGVSLIIIKTFTTTLSPKMVAMRLLFFLKELNAMAESLLQLSVVLLIWLTVFFIIYSKASRLLNGWCFKGQYFNFANNTASPSFIRVYLPSPAQQQSNAIITTPSEYMRRLDTVKQRFATKWKDDYERLRELKIFSDFAGGAVTPQSRHRALHCTWPRAIDQATVRGASIMKIPDCPSWWSCPPPLTRSLRDNNRTLRDNSWPRNDNPNLVYKCMDNPNFIPTPPPKQSRSRLPSGAANM